MPNKELIEPDLRMSVDDRVAKSRIATTGRGRSASTPESIDTGTVGQRAEPVETRCSEFDQTYDAVI